MNRIGFHHTHETQPSRMIYVDSSDATHMTQQNTSHYTYSFKDAVESGPGEGMLVSLSSASIPYSFYNVRADINDKLYYSDDSVDTNISIRPGNYSANALAKEIVNKFAAELPVQTVTAEYDKVTQKFTFGSATTLNFKFVKTGAIKDEIGFGASTGTIQISDGAGTLKTESPQVADLNGSVHAVYVRTNLATRSVLESMTGGVSDILAKIDINSDPGGVITLDPNQVSHEALIHTRAVKHLEIRITDDRGRLLDLNGLHSQVGFRFRFVDLKRSAAVIQGDPRVRVSARDVENERRSAQDKKVLLRKKAFRKGKDIVKNHKQ